jgi:hypothetical protein
MVSTVRLGSAGGVGKSGLVSHSGSAGRERFSAGFQFGGAGKGQEWQKQPLFGEDWEADEGK